VPLEQRGENRGEASERLNSIDASGFQSQRKKKGRIGQEVIRSRLQTAGSEKQQEGKSFIKMTEGHEVNIPHEGRKSGHYGRRAQGRRRTYSLA